MTVSKIAMAGGIFAIMSFIHFFVDWIFQSHSEAMVKHNRPWIRTKHCLIYAIGFIPILLILKFNLLEFLISINILFWSHFVEDTYFPVYLWAKYIRRPPEMTEPWKEDVLSIDGSTTIKVNPPDAKKGFVQFIQTPIGKILMISIDQIIHLTFLWPIVFISMNHL